MPDTPFSAQVTKRALLRALVVVTVLLGLTPALIVGGAMGVWAYRHAYQAGHAAGYAAGDSAGHAAGYAVGYGVGHNDGYTAGFRDGAAGW